MLKILKVKAENEQLRQQLAARDEQLAAREQELTEQFRIRLEEINAQHAKEVEAVQLELKLLIERIFGRKSERYIDSPEQLKLDLGVNDEQVDDAVEGLQLAVDEIIVADEVATDTKAKPKAKPRHGGAQKFPEHLDKKIVDVDLDDEQKAGLTHIGYDPVQKLHMSPPRFWVVETRYHKYINPAVKEAGVQSPSRPETGLVKGDHYDSSIAAEVIANRFGYHLPFYRQQDLFAGCGWIPSRSTLANLQSSAAVLIHPLVQSMAALVRSDSVLGTDDTGVKLLLPKTLPQVDPEDRKSARACEVITAAIESQQRHVNAKFWAYRGVTIPINVFDFTVSRHRDGPDHFLIDSNYQGTLLGDCYGANTGIAMRSSGEIIHAACVAHARRHINDAKSTHERHGRVLMNCFQELYEIEDRGRLLEPAARLALRQDESLLVWNRMRDYMTTGMLDLLPKEKMRKAIGYIHNQWTALTHYLSDPLVPIDNNETEQLMKQVAVGRKNWLFVGSLQSGYQMSDLMTLVSSAIRNDLHVAAYVKSVLDSLLSGSTDYESLRPDVWGKSHPEHCRAYRKEERETRAHRKQESRSKRRRLAATNT